MHHSFNLKSVRPINTKHFQSDVLWFITLQMFLLSFVKVWRYLSLKFLPPHQHNKARLNLICGTPTTKNIPQCHNDTATLGNPQTHCQQVLLVEILKRVPSISKRILTIKSFFLKAKNVQIQFLKCEYIHTFLLQLIE